MESVYRISGNKIPELSEVGGKGLSLIKMSSNSLPVPDGFILTVEFFTPWLKKLRRTEEWKKFQNTDLKNLEKNCKNLQKLCPELGFTPKQRKLVEEDLSQFPEGLWAVRSSSPEEDLEGASFAGGYETVLGVKNKNIESAVKECFASCLDYRVYLYKKEHGFIPDKPKIAVVIQEQIPSESAGVGFSLNPMTNCYDEAVFNANWGQGETVVSGQVSPDNFVVDKTNMEIIEKTIGGKETSIWLGKDGGTEESVSEKKDEIALSEKQVKALTKLVIKVEKYYEKPMDIEWAYANNKLYLIQGRPITTLIPLPPEMITKPGKPKNLYFDLTLGIQGIHEPVSVMGLDWLQNLFHLFSKTVFGKDILTDNQKGLLIARGGRVYVNLSNLLHIIPKEKYANTIAIMDSITSETLKSRDVSEYLQEEFPEKAKTLILKLLFNTPETFAKMIEGHFFPKMLEKNYQKNMKLFQEKVCTLSEKECSLTDFSLAVQKETIDLLVHTSVPAVASFMKAQKGIEKIFPDKKDKKTKVLLDDLTKSLPHNVTVEMGLEIFQLSQMLPKQSTDSPVELLKKIKSRKMGEGFMIEWDRFITEYGFRGARELDIAATPYSDQPEMIINQLIQSSDMGEGSDNPQIRYDQAQIDRYTAYEKLSEKLHKKGWIKLKHFQKLFKIVESLGGYRESHKYNLIFGKNQVRKKVLELAEKLVSQGRLDNAEDVFQLKISDIDDALKRPSLDLRELIKERTLFWDQIKNIKSFPHLIDSRGKILRPPRKEAGPGEIVGEGVSAGVAKGAVKILNTPDEKPLLPGEILVTRATDPGWTPLFINAAAVVLEVGGMLQHGALVAREYGKPCVVGIENVTSLLKDGEVVTVDGDNGIVKVKV